MLTTSLVFLAQTALPALPPPVTVFGGDLFLERRSCGGVPPQIEAIEIQLFKLEADLSESQKAVKLFEILHLELSQRGMPTVGGCHSGSEFSFNPKTLQRYANSSPEAFQAFEKVLDGVKAGDGVRGQWLYYMATSNQATAEKKKALLEQSLEYYDRWYAKIPGDSGNEEYADLLKLLKKKPPRRIVLATTSYAEGPCGGTGELSVLEPTHLTEKQIPWLKSLLSFLYSMPYGGMYAPGEDEYIEMNINKEEIESLMKQEEFLKWLPDDLEIDVRPLMELSDAVDWRHLAGLPFAEERAKREALKSQIEGYYLLKKAAIEKAFKMFHILRREFYAC